MHHLLHQIHFTASFQGNPGKPETEPHETILNLLCRKSWPRWQHGQSELRDMH